MRNIDKAVEIITDANAKRRERRGDFVDIVTIQAAEEYVAALQAAGLIPPDPSNDEPPVYWEVPHGIIGVDGDRVIIGFKRQEIRVEDAGEIIAALTAAKTYAERGVYQ